MILYFLFGSVALMDLLKIDNALLCSFSLYTLQSLIYPIYFKALSYVLLIILVHLLPALTVKYLHVVLSIFVLAAIYVNLQFIERSL